MRTIEEQLTLFKEEIYRNLNIDLNAYKPKQLHRRILGIMNRSGYEELQEYSRAIRLDRKIRMQFLDYITINVSEFFRNKEMFEDLQKRIGEILLPKHTDLKFWSAACSIGAEPYTLSIILDKISKGKNHKILATDIDEGILTRAREGIYSTNDIKNVSTADRDKYFLVQDQKFHIKKDIKENVTFKKHDLILDDYETGFHLIVCRNVVIYFNNDVKENIYKKFYQSLLPGGLLFVGATETIFNYREMGFKKISTFLYQKE